MSKPASEETPEVILAVAARLVEQHIKLPNGCWEWTSYTTKEGYGRTEFQGRKYMAHRLSYALRFGPIAPGKLVLHHCDNPRCINPAHLFLGTDLDNTVDKVSKGRHAHGPQHSVWSRGEKQHMSRLTEADVRKILADSRSQSVIGKEFGIGQTHVSQIKRRVIWKHVSP